MRTSLMSVVLFEAHLSHSLVSWSSEKFAHGCNTFVSTPCQFQTFAKIIVTFVGVILVGLLLILLVGCQAAQGF